MSGILQVLNNSFKTFLDQGDVRVKDWPMMHTPFPGMAMIAAYIYFVKVAGPQYMKKRKPYDLRLTMVIYNFLLVFINLFLFLGLGWYSYFNGYSLKCQPMDYSNKHEAVRLAQMGYLFYLTKFVEFADTIFFCSLVWNQICTRWLQHFISLSELFRSCDYVWLLWSSSSRGEVQEILNLEEIHDVLAAGAVCHRDSVRHLLVCE
ncbi:elongation of very long chain fatty acids protein AAEL008004 [Caerostris extrusa]|uniref:Elongation of very long chain fatty acids protein n=1 Tax=Caerostris extrusa TaxID=172846 RepID=A0AAV4SCN9_CAEEX|nr:elongation of very long chain fatty acids protein AAEL008004 [Caerostris extrusa]